MGAIQSIFTVKYTLWSPDNQQITAEIRVDQNDSGFIQFMQNLRGGNIRSVDYVSMPNEILRAVVVKIKSSLNDNRSPTPVIIRESEIHPSMPTELLSQWISVMHKKFAIDDVEFVPLDKKNYTRAIELVVAPEQDEFVGTVAEGIADAHFNPTYVCWAIQFGAAFVGFVMFDPTSEKTDPIGNIAIHKFLLDCHFQRRGLGSLSLTAFIEKCRRDYPNASIIELRTNENNISAVKLYEKSGFVMSQEGTRNVLRGVYRF